MKVSSVDQMRVMDGRAIEVYGIPEEILMENAALAAADVVMRKYPTASRFLLVCGAGNNGGDGFALARKLHSLGMVATIAFVGAPDSLKGAAALNYEILSRLNLPVVVASSGADVSRLAKDADVVIDALFGTGLSRPVEGRYADIIQAVNDGDKPVVSLDIPSGIQGDTGQVLGSAVRAETTVTFGLPKYGNLLYPGAERCGTLYVTHISFPAALYRDESGAGRLSVEVNEPAPPPARNPSGHKGGFGDVLFIAGAEGYFGAPYFAAMAMLKSGGGYARLAAPKSICEHVAQGAREAVFYPMEETAEGSLALSSTEKLLALSAKRDFVVLGPGISLASETRDLARRLIQHVEKPLLVDGDALTALSENPNILAGRNHPAILTPHTGEFSRLTGIAVDDIEADRIAALKEALSRFKCYILLKGAHSLIGYPDGRIFVNLTGNSGMATAGSGDVLAGAIAAMYAFSQASAGDCIGDSVRNGVFIHGLAGDIAAEGLGEDGVTASDILASLPEAVRRLRAGEWTNPIVLV